MGLDEVNNNNAYVLSPDQQNRVNTICKRYLEEIVPLLTNLEIIDLEYPIEITNEIRALFTHLSRCYSFPKTVDIDAQIIAAERHVKRALLDCYKYTCLSHADYIKQFRNDYQDIDLSLVNSGMFISFLREKTVSAQNKIEKAKQADAYSVVITNDLEIKTTDPNFEDYCRSICDDDLFSLYQDAYVDYSQCVEAIKSNQHAVDFLVDKAARIQRINLWGLIVGIAGAIIGLVGIIVAFIK